VPDPKTQKSRKVKIMNEASMTLVGNLVEDPELPPTDSSMSRSLTTR
jgi:hypothetical protein